MKKLLSIALLCIGSMASYAHEYHNGSGCAVEFREVCIDLATCTIVSTSGWTSVPPLTGPTPLPRSICSGPGIQRAYEVRYAASTGCSTASVTVTGPILCPPFINSVLQLPPCSCTHTSGVTIHFDGDLLDIDP